MVGIVSFKYRIDDQDAIRESEIQYANQCSVRAGGKKEVTFQCNLW